MNLNQNNTLHTKKPNQEYNADCNTKKHPKLRTYKLFELPVENLKLPSNAQVYCNHSNTIYEAILQLLTYLK